MPTVSVDIGVVGRFRALAPKPSKDLRVEQFDQATIDMVADARPVSAIIRNSSTPNLQGSY